MSQHKQHKNLGQPPSDRLKRLEKSISQRKRGEVEEERAREKQPGD